MQNFIPYQIAGSANEKNEVLPEVRRFFIPTSGVT